MKKERKSICMGVGYALVFHMFGWGAAVLNVEKVLSRIPGLILFFAVLLALVPAYVSAMEHVKQKWVFRLSVLVAFLLFAVFAFFLADRLATGFLKDLEYFLLGYVILLAMMVIFLFDALVLVVRYVKRQLRNRAA